MVYFNPNPPPLTGHISPIEESMAMLTEAVYDVSNLYLRSFCPPSSSVSSSCAQDTEGKEQAGERSSKEASGTTDHLQFTLFAMHGIPTNWVSR